MVVHDCPTWFKHKERDWNLSPVQMGGHAEETVGRTRGKRNSERSPARNRRSGSRQRKPRRSRSRTADRKRKRERSKPAAQYGLDPQKNKTKKNALNNFLRSLALFKHDFYVISSKKQRMNLTWDSKLDKFLKDLQRYLDPKLPVH